MVEVLLVGTYVLRRSNYGAPMCFGAFEAVYDHLGFSFDHFRPLETKNDPKMAQDHSKTVPKAIIVHVDFLFQF